MSDQQQSEFEHLLTNAEWARITDASWNGGARAWRAEIEKIIGERELRAAAQALRSAALSVPMGPKPDPADYLRECADVISPPAGGDDRG